MNIIEFQEKYGTEEQCRQYLFEKRWSAGFVCPKCGYSEYFKVQSRYLCQCKACNHQVSVTAGTIMDKTRIPLVKWFMAFFLMEQNRDMSTLMLAKHIDVAYNTALTMCNKIRYVMSTRNIFAKLKNQQNTKKTVPAERKKETQSTLKKTSIFWVLPKTDKSALIS